MKVILDCNVLIAAALKDGICRAVVFYAIQHSNLFLSESIILEYLLVARRKKFERYQYFLEKLIILFSDVATMIEPKDFIIKLPDPSDVKYINLALHTNAQYLITGNKKDFPENTYGITQIISPRDFRALILF